MDDLVDVTLPLRVDAAGRLVLGDGTEIHPCCLEAVTYGHGDCTFDDAPTPPPRLRKPIPVKENWRGK